MFKLGSQLRGSQCDLFQSEEIQFSEFFVQCDEIVSGERFEPAFFDIVFDEESEEGLVSIDVPTAAIEAPRMRGFL